MISDADANQLARELHPELLDWTPEDFDRAEREEGVNWHFHLTLDEVVLCRASDPTLPDAKVINDLRDLGDTRLEAIHRIAGTIASHIWKLLWVGRAQSGEIHPEDVPEKLRGAALPTNEELNDRIEALVAERAEQGHRSRTRPSGRRKR